MWKMYAVGVKVLGLGSGSHLWEEEREDDKADPVDDAGELKSIGNCGGRLMKLHWGNPVVNHLSLYKDLR